MRWVSDRSAARKLTGPPTCPPDAPPNQSECSSMLKFSYTLLIPQKATYYKSNMKQGIIFLDQLNRSINTPLPPLKTEPLFISTQPFLTNTSQNCPHSQWHPQSSSPESQATSAANSSTTSQKPTRNTKSAPSSAPLHNCKRSLQHTPLSTSSSETSTPQKS